LLKLIVEIVGKMPFVDGLNCFSVDLYPRSLFTLKDALHYMMHHQESRWVVFFKILLNL